MPGKHTKPNPTGMQIHSLAHRKGAGVGQQTFSRGIPSQSWVRGDGAKPLRAHRAAQVLSSAQLQTWHHIPWASGEGWVRWRHKAAREKMHLHAAETQNRHDGLSEKKQKPEQSSVHRKTCKTKKAHERQQEKRRAYTFFP